MWSKVQKADFKRSTGGTDNTQLHNPYSFLRGKNEIRWDVACVTTWPGWPYLCLAPNWPEHCLTTAVGNLRGSSQSNHLLPLIVWVSFSAQRLVLPKGVALIKNNYNWIYMNHASGEPAKAITSTTGNQLALALSSINFSLAKPSSHMYILHI